MRLTSTAGKPAWASFLTEISAERATILRELSKQRDLGEGTNRTNSVLVHEAAVSCTRNSPGVIVKRQSL